MSDTNDKPACPDCGDGLWHGHDEAHGLSGTHMGGSERYECRQCDKTWYKKDGEEIGLKFILD